MLALLGSCSSYAPSSRPPQVRRGARGRHAAVRAVANMEDYGAEQITVLEGLEPVRKRPGMYIGSTGSRGLHHLVYEVVDNSIDEVLAGHATTIDITLGADGACTVQDDGRGIPCDVHAKTGKPALETVLTVLHAGGKFGDGGYKISSGLHGVGVSVVNALSSALSVEVARDGALHTMAFARGGVVAPMTTESGGAEGRSGTRLTFTPDSSIFKAGVAFDWEPLAARFDEQAYLHAGLGLTLTDERKSPPRTETFCHEGGLAEYVESLCTGKKPLWGDAKSADPEQRPVVRMEATSGGVAVDIALRWSADAYTDTIVGFANAVRTPNGGSHVDGLRAAITRVVNTLARANGKLKEKSPNLAGEFVREGLTAVVSVKLGEAEFEGQTKSKLGNPEVRGIVGEVVAEELTDFLQRRPKALSAIVDKATAAAKAAEAAKAARDLVRRKTVLGSSVLPGKLADCASSNATESEVFIVEGDSAGGSAKQGRSRHTQAVLPLRGKILNVEKADDASMYQNAEIQALIACLGLGIKGEDFVSSQLRYEKIILMTDADVDGAHIRTLLLTFLYRYQRAVVEQGYVYIAYPPLFKVRHRGKVSYAYSDEELAKNIAEMNGAKPTTQRFKGLGEMMPAELWSTTMDPTTRLLKRVTVSDAAEADRVFSMLMGGDAAPRKEFINRHAGTLDWDALDL